MTFSFSLSLSLSMLIDFFITTARLSSMPWHVAAAAVWLVVMGWCGSIVTGQPVTGIQDHRIEMPQRYPSNEEGQAIRQLWGMGDPVDDKSAEIQDEDFRQDLYYLPKVPSKRFTPEEESGWFVQSQVPFSFQCFRLKFDLGS